MTDDDEVLEIVIYDACVLYPYTLRDTLISLTRARKFQARWTHKINEEWTRNLLKNEPAIAAERLKRTCELMSLAVPDAIVSGYEHLIDQVELPDPRDRHVLAAAIYVEASKIITENVMHFPQATASTWEIEVCRPDTFVAGQYKDYSTDVLPGVEEAKTSVSKSPTIRRRVFSLAYESRT